MNSPELSVKFWDFSVALTGGGGAGLQPVLYGARVFAFCPLGYHPGRGVIAVFHHYDGPSMESQLGIWLRNGSFLFL